MTNLGIVHRYLSAFPPLRKPSSQNRCLMKGLKIRFPSFSTQNHMGSMDPLGMEPVIRFKGLPGKLVVLGIAAAHQNPETFA